jgi:hypothetical protein
LSRRLSILHQGDQRRDSRGIRLTYSSAINRDEGTFDCTDAIGPAPSAIPQEKTMTFVSTADHPASSRLPGTAAHHLQDRISAVQPLTRGS